MNPLKNPTTYTGYDGKNYIAQYSSFNNPGGLKSLRISHQNGGIITDRLVSELYVENFYQHIRIFIVNHKNQIT